MKTRSLPLLLTVFLLGFCIVGFPGNSAFAGDLDLPPCVPTCGPPPAPTLTAVTIVSNNASTTLAKTGDTVTLTFTASTTIAAPSVTIEGQSTTTANTSGNTYTALYTLQSTDTGGVVPFTIDFSDTGGTPGIEVTATSDGSSVTFDKTPPVIASHADVSVQATSSASVAVAYTNPVVSDDLASVVASCAPSSGSLFSVGTTTVTCNASDDAGNAAAPTSFGVGVADAPPVATLPAPTPPPPPAQTGGGSNGPPVANPPPPPPPSPAPSSAPDGGGGSSTGSGSSSGGAPVAPPETGSRSADAPAAASPPGTVGGDPSFTTGNAIHVDTSVNGPPSGNTTPLPADPPPTASADPQAAAAASAAPAAGSGWWWLWLLLILLALSGGWWAWKKYFNKKKAAPER